MYCVLDRFRKRQEYRFYVTSLYISKYCCVNEEAHKLHMHIWVFYVILANLKTKRISLITASDYPRVQRGKIFYSQMCQCLLTTSMLIPKPEQNDQNKGPVKWY